MDKWLNPILGQIKYKRNLELLVCQKVTRCSKKKKKKKRIPVKGSGSNIKELSLAKVEII